MSLASNYAALLSEGTSVDKTLAYMKSRGHLSLLSQVIRILKREPAGKNAPVVLLAKESDTKKFAKQIGEAFRALDALEKDAETVVDERVVGGYAVRTRSRIVDRTYRTALVGLYKKAVGNN